MIGVVVVGFVLKKVIGVVDGIKGIFVYLIGDSFVKLGFGMIVDGILVFGLIGWVGIFVVLDVVVVGCICLMVIVVIFEECKICCEKKNCIL